MRKFLQSMAVLALCLGVTTAAMAQSRQVKGKVMDASTDQPLTGATIISTNTNAAAVANADGSFSLSMPSTEQEVTVSFLGYIQQVVKVDAGSDLDLGTIALQVDSYAMEAVVIQAGVVVNDRQTPIAISNVTVDEIETKLGNQEFPEILKSTPSVYATKDGGGYGDSRISIRGFGSENIGVLINGVPVNDMENGRVYWSNWAGLSDVTSLMQVQRGLGASRLGLSSVGGTINIVTRSTDAVQGGTVYYGIGNDGLQKEQFSVSTGLMDNGWAITLAGGHSKSNGYIIGTDYEAWNYFGNISKQLGGGHRLSLTAFGAPQWHNQRGGGRYLIEDFQNSVDGVRMNKLYGYINGKVVSPSYNIYHKPQISLVHNWTIDDNSSWNTSIYASLSSGGGRTQHGLNSGWLRLNQGQVVDGVTKLNQYGLIDYDYIYEQNANNLNGSSAIFARSVNSHDWYGILSTYNTKLTDNIAITAGFDGRYYKGYHREQIEDLLGGDYYIAETNGTNALPGLGRLKNQHLGVGDVIGYDEVGEVLWAGAFAQAEYLKDNFSAFLSGTVTSHSYRWSNFGDDPDNGKFVSDWVGYLPLSIKGGANYEFAQYHNVFINGGYFTRAPFKNNAFIGYTTVPNPEAKFEKVTTAEIGYGFANNFLNVKLNGYFTLWLDKSMAPRTETAGLDENGNPILNIYNFSGVNAQHMGVELEAIYRPTTTFNLRGMLSFGDWIWRDDVNVQSYDENQNPVGAPFVAYIAGVHVGNAAQATGYLSANWEPFKDFRVSLDFNWFGKNYADFRPDARGNAAEAGVEAWQMPDYYTFDFSANYKFNIGKQSLTLYGNINNLLNAEYISDATDGATHVAYDALVYYGFGRTWSIGLKLNF